MHKITSKDIFNYIEGNTRFALDQVGLVSQHIKEQVAYRLLTCKNDCVVSGRCMVCGCELPNRAFSTVSCNHQRFPNMMNEEDWNQFKIDNNLA